MAAAAAYAKEVESSTLKKGIAEFYDESSGMWEDIWGEHMHHGFYDPDADVSLSDHRSAQIRMVEESLRFASVSGSPLSISFSSFTTYISICSYMYLYRLSKLVSISCLLYILGVFLTLTIQLHQVNLKQL